MLKTKKNTFSTTATSETQLQM